VKIRVLALVDILIFGAQLVRVEADAAAPPPAAPTHTVTSAVAP